ncbi:MAG: leucine-rich repeat domain-containing protein, partial [Clostridia bacterium]|nr:leucine-rich repeat domain-containing protein [Clostridia bacterium]
MKTYTYTGGFFDIKTQEQLSDEGVLEGQYGTLHFRRCADGYAIYDSSFIGSGFVSTPTAANIAYPKHINGIPVTEVHNSIQIDNCRYPIAIEGGSLKRVYLNIGRKTGTDNKSTGLEGLIMAMFNSTSSDREKHEPLNISIDFCTEGRAVDFCEIRCDEKCIMRGIASKRLEVVAPSVILADKAYGSLEYVKFSGRVYPYTYSDWYGDTEEIGYFENAESLRAIDGSLCGKACWSFKGCKSLERVHLANGIQKVPSYSFANCSSLTDLYIPDTVSEIGEYAFADCTKLEKIHLPSNIKKISKGLFKNCCSLEKCYLSDSIEEIEEEAFIGCAALRKPWIPKGIKRIEKNAFDDPSWAKIF